METQKQSYFQWENTRVPDYELLPTQYQGVIHYEVGGDTTYFVTDKYYDYKIAEKVAKYYTSVDAEVIDGYDKVWYEILTDCPTCQYK